MCLAKTNVVWGVVLLNFVVVPLSLEIEAVFSKKLVVS